MVDRLEGEKPLRDRFQVILAVQMPLTPHTLIFYAIGSTRRNIITYAMLCIFVRMKKLAIGKRNSQQRVSS